MKRVGDHDEVLRRPLSRLLISLCILFLSQALFQSAALAQGTQPEIVSPEPGTTLSGTSETFTWVSNGARFGKVQLWVGTSVGASNIFDSGVLLKTVTSQTVNGLPSDGSTVYVHLRIRRDRVWHDVADYQYTACRGCRANIVPVLELLLLRD